MELLILVAETETDPSIAMTTDDGGVPDVNELIMVVPI